MVPGNQPIQNGPKMNMDAMVAFGIASAALVGSTFASNPHVALACQLIGGELTALAVAFHLDGK